MNHDPGEIRTYLRTKRLRLAVGALVLASLATAAQVAPFPTLTALNIVILGAIPYGLFSAGRVLWHLRQSRARSVYNLLVALLCLLTLPLLFLGYHTSAREARAVAGRVVSSVERYRMEHDSYPKTLDALVPKYLSKVPKCHIDRARYLLLDDGSYGVVCSAYLYMRWSYHSKTGNWTLAD